MTAHLIRFALFVIGFSVTLALIHWGVVTAFPLEISTRMVFGIHIFLAVLSFLLYIPVVWVARHTYDKTGFSFLASVIFKMMLAVVWFKWVLARAEVEAESLALHFMASYLLYLIAEARAVALLLKNESSEASS